MNDKRMVVGKIVLGQTSLPIEDALKYVNKIVREPGTIIIRVPKKRMRQIESRAKLASLSVTDYMLAAVDAFEAAFKPPNKAKEASAMAKRIVSIILQAIDAFGSTATAGRWLKKPCRALNNKTPLSLLHEDAGRILVINVLGQIKHGIYS